MTFFDEIKSAGIPFSNHESDLYVKDTPEARAILARHPIQQRIVQRFTNRLEGGQWLDIPFAYVPWWEKRSIYNHATPRGTVQIQ